MLIDDTGVTASFFIDDNVIKNLSQELPDPSSVGIPQAAPGHVVWSRGLTLITIDHSVSNLHLSHYDASNLSPFGTFAADGVVFLDCGYTPLVNAELSDLSISNPFLTGDNTNGDSIEIQHRASDLGGGTLGSHGRNRFVNNDVPGNLPRGVTPAGIDPVAAVDGDVSVSFSPATPAPATKIQLFAEHNYWSGGAPAISSTAGGAPATDIYFTPGGVIFW